MLSKYYVEIDFLHKPTYRVSNIESVNECQAVMKAVENSPYPSNTMYRNATSTAITMDKRNQMIRDWYQEEADSGNI